MSSDQGDRDAVERAPQNERPAALFGAEIAVARAQGKAVGIAHDGASDQVDREVKIAHHLPHDGELCGILQA